MRQYNLNESELIDRLSILSLKEIFIPQNKKNYAEEIQQIVHDLSELFKGKEINGDFIRDLMLIQLMNSLIWSNESGYRNQHAGIKEEKKYNLELTHSLNSIRTLIRSKIQSHFGGRVDYKIDYMEDANNYLPSGYKSSQEKLEELKNS